MLNGKVGCYCYPVLVYNSSTHNNPHFLYNMTHRTVVVLTKGSLESAVIRFSRHFTLVGMIQCHKDWVCTSLSLSSVILALLVSSTCKVQNCVTHMGSSVYLEQGSSMY